MIVLPLHLKHFEKLKKQVTTSKLLNLVMMPFLEIVQTVFRILDVFYR